MLEKLNPEIYAELTKDIENLKSLNFRWDELDAGDVRERALFVSEDLELFSYFRPM